MDITNQIKELKHSKNAVLLGHYYLKPELQELMDHIGDSLALAQAAQSTQADAIVFCGVHFMAETAKILNPDKPVWIPDATAGCSLADACDADELARFKADHPHHKIISYINCSARVKALSDVICTSGNALKIVDSFSKETPILFAPDKNLGAYINAQLGRDMLLWNGSCHVHDQLKAESLILLKQKYPQARFIAHPECNAAVLELADLIGSTAVMLKDVQTHPANEYIVATETGILHQMQRLAPHKTLHLVPANDHCACNDCPYMKQNTLSLLRDCLLNETPAIEMDSALMDAARKPLLKMLELSR